MSNVSVRRASRHRYCAPCQDARRTDSSMVNECEMEGGSCLLKTNWSVVANSHSLSCFFFLVSISLSDVSFQASWANGGAVGKKQVTVQARQRKAMTVECLQQRWMKVERDERRKKKKTQNKRGW